MQCFQKSAPGVSYIHTTESRPDVTSVMCNRPSQRASDRC